jgi:hypothetical protein
MGDRDDQLVVVRGVICANQNSARNRSPASNCACEIIASPRRSLRRRSQAIGLSSALNVSFARGLPAAALSPLRTCCLSLLD